MFNWLKNLLSNSSTLSYRLDCNAEVVSANKGLSFGEAIEYMRKGYKVRREGWNGKDQWIALQTPDEHSKMTLPYVYIRTQQGDLIPWLASQSDILSYDWEIVDIE